MTLFFDRFDSLIENFMLLSLWAPSLIGVIFFFLEICNKYIKLKFLINVLTNIFIIIIIIIIIILVMQITILFQTIPMRSFIY